MFPKPNAYIPIVHNMPIKLQEQREQARTSASTNKHAQAHFGLIELPGSCHGWQALAC